MKKMDFELQKKLKNKTHLRFTNENLSTIYK